ncbi:small ribosomal subunit protein uS9m-like [Rhopilema esculentum]|uniref:small ribosomal subunit protein uS9m-like n=1 Tax=Rhopilema esculentum TaxID=499914 RepID=UPI0031DB0550
MLLNNIRAVTKTICLCKMLQNVRAERVVHQILRPSISALILAGMRRHTTAAKEQPPTNSSTDVKNGDKTEENVDWLMVSEMEKYELGKRWLATMMGEDVSSFTDEKISEAIKYLLPSHLFAEDARPSMKNPQDIFGKRKELRVDAGGRPFHSAFYTGQEAYHELIYNIWKNLESLEKMPNSPQTITEQDEPLSFFDKPLLVRWLKHHEMEDLLHCKLADNQYDLILRRLSRIAKHPNGEAMQDFLSKYQVQLSEGGKKIEVAQIDENGVVTTMGYRKCAIAEVKLKEGSGKVMINNMPMTKFFHTFDHRKQVLFPLMVTGQLGKFDVDAGVIGGGPTGQAGAIRFGISQALLSFSESFFQPLDNAGLLLRDRRKVERKKPGQKKARKKFAWVKR